jgi:hypothetical protein
VQMKKRLAQRLEKLWADRIRVPDSFDYDTAPAHEALLDSKTIAKQRKLIKETRGLTTTLVEGEAKDTSRLNSHRPARQVPRLSSRFQAWNSEPMYLQLHPRRSYSRSLEQSKMCGSSAVVRGASGAQTRRSSSATCFDMFRVEFASDRGLTHTPSHHLWPVGLG